MRQTLFVLPLLLAGCSGPTPQAPSPPSEESISFPTAAGSGQGRLFRPPPKLTSGARVLVIHGDHGLTDTVLANARRISSVGYLVLAVDLYRGEKVETLLDAHIMDRGLPEERVRADLRGAIDYLQAHPQGTDPVAVVGFDMGGGYALDAAVADPRIRGVVTCYGRVTTDAEVLAPMQASVLGLYAGLDEGNPPETLEAFRKAMAKAGKRLAGLHVLAGASHGFMNPTPEARPTPADEKARALGWRYLEEYLAGLRP